MQSPEARPVIRMYNRMVHVLMEFEMLYHQAWVRSLDAVQEGTLPALRMHTDSLVLISMVLQAVASL